MTNYRPDGPFKKGHPVPYDWRLAVSKAHKGKRDEAFRRKRSEAQKKVWKRAEYRKLMSVALSKPRKAFSEETKRRMRESQWIKKRIAEGLPHPQKGKPQYWCRGENNPAKRPEVRRKISEKQRLFLKEHPELWLNAKLAKLNRASKPQLRLLNIVKQAFPDAQLNYRILGTRRFADVGVPSEKVDFEFNGEYWHRNREKEDEERILEINRAGWSVFIIEQRHLDHHDVEALLGLPDMMEHL